MGTACTRRNSFDRTSSRGPSACGRPSPMTSTRSTALSAAARCATMTRMPSPLAHAQNRLRQRFVALHVEVRIRLVEHDQERFAIERPGERDSLALPGGERRPAFADLRLVPVAADGGSSRARRRLCRRNDRLGSLFASKREMFCATVPANSSTSCGRYPIWRPSRSDDHCSSAAPSSRIVPRIGSHDADQRAASDDLPEPLGPMMPDPLPACSRNETPCTTVLRPLGGSNRHILDEKLRGRRRQLHREFSGGRAMSKSLSRRQLWRAAIKPRH